MSPNMILEISEKFNRDKCYERVAKFDVSNRTKE